MYPALSKTVEHFRLQSISEARKTTLQPLINFVQQKAGSGKEVNLNFICTHNSRRSVLSQVWAKLASVYYQIPDVYCYSGGTEATALFPKVAETLSRQGFSVFKISETDNPVYAIRYAENALPIIGFSKPYDSPFNPVSGFAALMTCSQADGDCPFITGAEKRIPVTFKDPKVSDGTTAQSEVYAERSLQIAREMFYVFSMIKK